MNFVLTPNRGRKTFNWLYVPPYKFEVETMLSPALASAAMAMNCAAWPDVAATAATPPSRAAILFSKTSTVGCRSCVSHAWGSSRTHVDRRIEESPVGS